ncbi:hypothetical protein BOX15_Mlig003212g2, partial [Macrostomum lignano]
AKNKYQRLNMLSSTNSDTFKCIVPVTLWSKEPPSHCITSIILMPEHSSIVTGSREGHIIVWDVQEQWKLKPEFVYFSHNTSVDVLCEVFVTLPDSTPDLDGHFVSSDASGKMMLWNMNAATCKLTRHSQFVHTAIKYYQSTSSSTPMLLCCGRYPDILVLNPATLDSLFTLSSRRKPQWMSAFSVFSHQGCNEDVLLGISSCGTVFMWTITGDEKKGGVKLEDESKTVRCMSTQAMACHPDNPRTLLLVTPKFWQIYDAVDMCLLVSQEAPKGTRWQSGDFLAINRVLVGTTDGEAYVYQLPAGATDGAEHLRRCEKPTLTCKLLLAGGGPTGNKPAEPYGPGFNPAAAGAVFLYHRLPAGGSLVICSHGQAGLTLWFLAPNVGAALPATAGGAALSGVRPSVHTSLRLLWPAERWPLADWEVTAATLVYTSGRLALGLQSGHIVLLTMMQWLAAACFQAPKPDPPTHLRLSGHTRAVTALLHPASLAPDRYNPIHLVSGAEDFSVALWDCESGSLIHLFCVHGGPVASLQLPPNGCQGSRLAVSVVSVAADHSVSLLNLRERRLLLLASRHLYPVLSVRWRPLEDLLVVHTSDNSAYVWQTEVPALDRIVSGPALEELLRRSEESLSDSSRSAAPLRVTKLRGEDSGGGRGLPIVLHFNVACLIERILSNDQLARLRSQSRDSETQESSRSPYLGGRSGPSAARLSDASSSRAAVSSVDAAAAAVNATTGADEQALTLQVAQLLLSLIHSWGLDTGLDRTVGETLGLWPPRIAPCFGLVRSRAACLLCPNPPPHWETNRQLTTLHLLATTALAGALATARTAASFKVWPLDQPHRASLAAAVEDPTADNDPTAAWNSASLSPPTAEQRQAWGLTLTHHTVLLADLLDPSLFQQPCLLSLAGLYHTASPHLRQAAQQLLMAELRRLGPAGRQELLGQHDLSLKTSLASLVLVCLICCEFPAGQSDLNLTRAAAGALIRLLQEPGQAGGEMAPCGSKRLLAPESRTAVDLLGRGFRTWEAHVDVTQVLRFLLDMAAELDRLMPNSSDSLTASTDSAASATVALSWRVLSSETDLALQARLALTQIATSRPQLFLITMRRELLRYNTLATNAHLAGAKAPEQAPVYKGRSTILKLLELLCERAAADVHDLMFDTIELLLFCLEGQLTRDRGLAELFPPISRFCTVSCNLKSGKIVAGNKIGQLAFFDIRAGKLHTTQAHRHGAGCSACAFSPDGRHVASLSATDNNVRFFQLSAPTLFNMGSSHIKTGKQFNVSPSLQGRSCRLNWIDPKTVAVLTPSGIHASFQP